ncbi:MAG: alkaline phosphatase family protein [Bacteroidetes bacterium]|nr:alkaline phosphatase family protein [Bacteroidota bacterium]
MRFRFLVFLSLLFAGFALQASDKPKLIVGIVVDQMRYDYLVRFKSGFGAGGFNRLLEGGRNFTSCNYNYIPTYTAPGHASIYTGTTPRVHGIVGNSWYDRRSGKAFSNVYDSTVTPIGSDEKAGLASPVNLMAPTIGDHLKAQLGKGTRVFSVSIKDRGAILPGGKAANGAFWYDSKSGLFTTSSYYYREAPVWLTEFNNRNLPVSLMSKDWVLKNPAMSFTGMTADEVEWEHDIFKEGDRSFPHTFSHLSEKKRADLLAFTPGGNEIVLELALTVLAKEGLGKSSGTDLLAISFSSPDYIGHSYGPNSLEVADCYLRLDEQIARLLSALDSEVGKDRYLLFLSADHGVSESHGYLRSVGVDCGHYVESPVKDSLNHFLSGYFGKDSLVLSVSNDQVYLNEDLITSEGIDQSSVMEAAARYLSLNLPQLVSVFDMDYLRNRPVVRSMEAMISNGWNPSRSGEIAFMSKPYFHNSDLSVGTSHGSGYSYDTHVPMLFYGWKVSPGTIDQPVYIIDIAPTVTRHLNMTSPGGASGLAQPLR